jgi:hypothetical protein
MFKNYILTAEKISMNNQINYYSMRVGPEKQRAMRGHAAGKHCFS